ncbi:MAG: hypothetical protein PWP28_2729 [Oceanotoga sp.]|jgi:predicted oxidoreductase|uniref:hypothetical protein n=1 Tax=Oceanotoga sp. TaxID=2108366 RepID=UPI00264DB84F|nr:hypothetical protein [Oceanotoga sp.]MDN5343847.1 hypothetical protein [Oceanotoga sp.]
MKKILTIILFVFISLCVHSEWNTFDSTDLLSEKKSTYIYTEAIDYTGELTEKPKLAIKIEETENLKISIMVMFDDYIGNNYYIVSNVKVDYVPVKYKFDQEDIIKSKWVVSTKGKTMIKKLNHI